MLSKKRVGQPVGAQRLPTAHPTAGPTPQPPASGSSLQALEEAADRSVGRNSETLPHTGQGTDSLKTQFSASPPFLPRAGGWASMLQAPGPESHLILRVPTWARGSPCRAGWARGGPLGSSGRQAAGRGGAGSRRALRSSLFGDTPAR